MKESIVCIAGAAIILSVAIWLAYSKGYCDGSGGVFVRGLFGGWDCLHLESKK